MHPTADVSSPMTVTVVPAHNFNPEKRKCFSAQQRKRLLLRVSHSSCVCVTLKFLLNTVERCKSCNCNISVAVERCNICNCNTTAPLCSVLYNCLVRSKYEIQASFCLSTLYWISLAIWWKRELRPEVLCAQVCRRLKIITLWNAWTFKMNLKWILICEAYLYDYVLCQLLLLLKWVKVCS